MSQIGLRRRTVVKSSFCCNLYQKDRTWFRLETSLPNSVRLYLRRCSRNSHLLVLILYTKASAPLMSFYMDRYSLHTNTQQNSNNISCNESANICLTRCYDMRQQGGYMLIYCILRVISMTVYNGMI